MTRNVRFQLCGRLSYRDAIESYYEKHPEATQPQVARATGAPRSAVRIVFARMVAEGRQRDKRKSACCSPE